MGTDRLHELLRQADAAAGPPPSLPDGLAERARRIERLRRRRTVLFSSAVAMLILAFGASLLLRDVGLHENAGGGRQVVRQTDLKPDGVRVRKEMARLRAEAESRLSVARRMAEIQRHYERLAALEAAGQRPDPVEQAQREMDRAACVLVHQADRLDRDLHLRRSAIESYRETIRLFPDTTWAAVARERLARLEQETGEML